MPDSWHALFDKLFVWTIVIFYLTRQPLIRWLFITLRGLVYQLLDKSKSHTDPVCIAMAKHIFELTNEYRQENGLRKLKWHNKLYRSSLYHARRMRETDEFEHTLSDGVELGTRIQRHGFAYREVRENLYLHSDFFGATPRRMAKIMLKGWINSPGHKENLDAQTMTHLGVAVLYCKKKGFYAVQNFGQPII